MVLNSQKLELNRIVSQGIFIAYCITALLLPSIANAHHSHAEFSKESVSIKGEVTRIIWRNPHPGMTLEVTDENDQTSELTIQILGNVNGMHRDGVTGEEFFVGQNITVHGFYSMRRKHLVLVNSATLSDGTFVALGPRSSSQGAIYGGKAETDVDLPQQDLEPSLFRVWTVLERTRDYDAPLNEAAASAKSAWDPLVDDPQRNCSPLGMPGAMMSPHPIQFVDQGDIFLLRLEEWDGERTIYMNGSVDTEQPTNSHLGKSTGDWDGSTLVVHTTDIDFPYMDEYGTPLSSRAETTEEFSLSEDGRYLDWQLVVTDPGTLTDSFRISTTRWQWLPGESLQPYDCADADQLIQR